MRQPNRGPQLMPSPRHHHTPKDLPKRRTILLLSSVVVADYFSGPGTAVGLMRMCLCIQMQTN